MKPFLQDDVFRSMHVKDGLLSPDARFAVYQLSETISGKSKDEDRQASSLWRVDLSGGAPRRLTAKGVDSHSPVVAPDGKSLLFLSARGEAKVFQIYRLPFDGGEAEPVTSLAQGVARFALSPDGKWIAFAAMEKVPEPAGSNAHIRIDRFAYRYDPVGYLPGVGQAIYLMDAQGSEPKALTAHDGIVSTLAWSPDSREIAAFVNGKEASPDWAARGELVIVGREGKERILAQRLLVSALTWTPDGKQVGFVGTPGRNHSNENQFWLVDSQGGEPVSRTAKLDRGVCGAIQVNSPAGFGPARVLLSGNDAIVRVANGGETSIYRIALSGPEATEPLLKGPRTLWPLDLAGATLLFAMQDCNTPSGLWVADLNTREERALTQHNAWQSEIAWPALERVVAKSGGGTVDIEGWIMTPHDGKPPYKTIVYIHGGPHAGFGYTYNEDFHELVGAGYALAFCNPRGSTGYGDAFAGSILGQRGVPELEDFDVFADELIRRGISDPDNIGLTGVSGGAHLSAWLTGHTDRYKASVPEQGGYDMFSMYGTSDGGTALTWLSMSGHPHEHPQRFWDLSVIAHAHKCRTPTLLIQGENDLRCPIGQAEELFTILKYNGCEAEFLRLRNCSHGVQVAGPPQLRRARMDAMKDWFARHI